MIIRAANSSIVFSLISGSSKEISKSRFSSVTPLWRRFCEILSAPVFSVKIAWMPPIDPARVQAKIRELALETPLHPNWVASDGFHALTVLTVEGDKVNFNPNLGIPLKTFINSDTGEIRTFDARAFKVITPSTPPNQYEQGRSDQLVERPVGR